MDNTIEEREKNLKEDIMIISDASEFIRTSKLREEEMAKYNENLKATFDSRVREVAMQIIDGQMSDKQNEGGGTLKYTSN